MDTVRIKSSHRPMRREDVTYHAIDDEALVYDPECGATHRLNSTARFIWEQCDGASDCAAIAADLIGVWDATLEQARVDVMDAVGSMVTNGLLDVKRD